MKTSTARKIIIGTVAAIVLWIIAANIDFSVPSGGSDRSVDNYCKAWLDYTKPKGEEYKAVEDAYELALNSSGTSEADKAKRTKAYEDMIKTYLGFAGDLAELYDTVEKVAPSEIEPDVARAAQDAHVFQEQQQSIPAGLRELGAGLFGQLMQSANASTTQKRIHDWNAAHCSNLQGKNDYFNFFL